MFADYTTLSAQAIADILHAVLTQAPEKFFRLETVQHGPDGDTTNEVLVRVLADPQGDGSVSILADETEIVHCATQDGRRVDILLGPPSKRGHDPVPVLFQSPD